MSKTVNSSLLVGAAMLLLSLGACGSSSTGAPTDGRPAADGQGGSTAHDAMDAVNGATTDVVHGGTDAVNGGTPAAGVALGGAGSYVILAMSGISTVPTSAVTGNLGVSPGAATLITGFSLIADSTNVFSRSPQVTGKVYAADYAVPTPAALTAAIGDMQLAFTDAAGRAPGVTELGAGNIGGMTLGPGVYKWGTGLLIPTDVSLTGSATDVWIFQIAQDFIMSSGSKIVLSGGALAKNVFWQVAGLVELGTTAHCEGTVLTKTAITLRTGASITGKLLAQTAVHLDSNRVVEP
jgi:hypothetical protein